VLSFATMDKHKAARHAAKAVERDPNHVLAWQRLAYLYLQTEDFDRALTAAQRLRGLGADATEWMIFEADVLLRLHRYSEAGECCTQVMAAMPALPAAYRCRALARLCLKQYAKAIDDYSRAVELLGFEGVWPRYQRATPLWITGQTDEAAADYRFVRRDRRSASYADARLFLVLCDEARHLDEAGDHGGAEIARQEACEALEDGRDGALPESWRANILACLAGDLTPDQLVAAADRQDPEQVCEGYYYAGEACLLLGRADRATECFEKCVDTGLVLDSNTFPADPMNEYHLALWRLGEAPIGTELASGAGAE